MRVLYSLLLYLLLPGVLLRLWIKGRRDPAYRRHWRERLGLDVPQGDRVIWLHAVSVGEVRAAEPLVRALRVRYAGQALLVTVTTPTGRRTVRQLFGDEVSCRYLPYDLPGAVRRFLAALQPAMLVVMEVELWPNLYRGLAARGVPLYLVNARLSEKSWRAYRCLGGLTGETLRSVRHIAAQSAADRTRFVQLGARADRVSVTGNLKSDVRLPGDFHTRSRQLRERLADGQPVWIAASTHEGEEALVLEAHAELLRHCPQALLILAPRHRNAAAKVSPVACPASRRVTAHQLSLSTSWACWCTATLLPTSRLSAAAWWEGADTIPSRPWWPGRRSSAGRTWIILPISMRNFYRRERQSLSAPLQNCRRACCGGWVMRRLARARSTQGRKW